jgi:hypothetical protein
LSSGVDFFRSLFTLLNDLFEYKTCIANVLEYLEHVRMSAPYLTGQVINTN